MTDAEVLNLPSNEFQAELLRRNTKIRGLSAQSDNLDKGIKSKQDEIEKLDAELESKKTELEKIDSIFEGKMADYQAHVDSVQKSLKEKEDGLTAQKATQDEKETAQHSKDLELTNRKNGIEKAKEALVEILNGHLKDYGTSIADALDTIKDI
jgi:chromosome segregation ATPase